MAERNPIFELGELHGETSTDDAPEIVIGGGGFEQRRVHLNRPALNAPARFGNNRIR